jgi:hypothetical protein
MSGKNDRAIAILHALTGSLDVPTSGVIAQLAEPRCRVRT